VYKHNKLWRLMLLELAQQSHQLSSNNSPNKRFSQHLYGWVPLYLPSQQPASQCLYMRYADEFRGTCENAKESGERKLKQQ
jgi:hypothetical protein